MKKIGFIGSHGTGKSTASYHLASLLKKANPNKSIVCLEENVRKIAKLTNGNLKSEEFPPLAISNQLFRELQSEQLYDIVITDRSTVDFFVYSRFTNFSLNNGFKSIAIEHMHSFNEIYFIRPDNRNSKISNDGFRNTDITFRNEVDELFESILDLNQIPYKELKTSEIFTHNYLKELQ